MAHLVVRERVACVSAVLVPRDRTPAVLLTFLFTVIKHLTKWCEEGRADSGLWCGRRGSNSRRRPVTPCPLSGSRERSVLEFISLSPFHSVRDLSPQGGSTHAGLVSLS